jgi:hypothetical protein
MNRLAKALQILAVLAGWVLTPYWCVMAFVLFPWIVPADSLGADRKYEIASRVALGLAIVSAASVLLASGIFANPRRRWTVATLLLAAHAGTACYLYPYREISDPRGIYCMVCQGVSVAVIVIGAFFGQPQQA